MPIVIARKVYDRKECKRDEEKEEKGGEFKMGEGIER